MISIGFQAQVKNLVIESYEPPSGSKWFEDLLGDRSRGYTPYRVPHTFKP